MKKIIFAGLGVFIIALAAFALWPRAQTAPDLNLTSLNGERLSNQNFQNKITLLNFWYPSCPGCTQEMPRLIAFQAGYKSKPVQVIGVAMPLNSEAEVREFVKRFNIPFTVAYDADNRAVKAYNVQLAPNTFVINAKGEVIKSYLGEPDWQDLAKIINREMPR